MPGFDGKGPGGMGPMTGGGRGNCAAAPAPSGRGPARRGYGMGQGGRGRRNRYYATGITGRQAGIFEGPEKER
jgi:hypothetical protein